MPLKKVKIDEYEFRVRMYEGINTSHTRKCDDVFDLLEKFTTFKRNYFIKAINEIMSNLKEGNRKVNARTLISDSGFSLLYSFDFAVSNVISRIYHGNDNFINTLCEVGNGGVVDKLLIANGINPDKYQTKFIEVICLLYGLNVKKITDDILYSARRDLSLIIEKAIAKSN